MKVRLFQQKFRNCVSENYIRHHREYLLSIFSTEFAHCNSPRIGLSVGRDLNEHIQRFYGFRIEILLFSYFLLLLIMKKQDLTK